MLVVSIAGLLLHQAQLVHPLRTESWPNQTIVQSAGREVLCVSNLHGQGPSPNQQIPAAAALSQDGFRAREVGQARRCSSCASSPGGVDSFSLGSRSE